MNILFLTSWYPSEENPLKGIFVKEHARAIRAGGNRIVVLAVLLSEGIPLYQQRTEKFIDENGIETHLLHIRSRFYKWIHINPFLLTSIIKRYFKKTIFPDFNPDVFHSNILYPAAVMGDSLARTYAKPHIITEHWSKIDKYMDKNLLSFLGRRAYRNARYITVVSDFLRSTLLNFVKDASRVQVIPNVIDTDIFSFSPKKPDSGKIIFSSVATWKLPKQPLLFVKALDKIASTVSEKIELNFIGEGPQLEEIKKMKLNYSVHYHGNLPKEQIAAILHRSDYFLHASLIETFSMVVAEALATGTPVIASKVGALPELVNEVNGVLADNTEEKWIQAIQRAINTKFDNALVSKTVSNKFDKKAIGSLFNSIYDAI